MVPPHLPAPRTWSLGALAWSAGWHLGYTWQKARLGYAASGEKYDDVRSRMVSGGTS